MRSSTLRRAFLAAAAPALIAVGVPLALAAPTAAPPSDTAGYLDSTARCSAPDVAAIFGSTQSSRVAICKTAAGAYEYRGVRISDGATLVAAATQTTGNTFTVRNDGVVYTVTPTALSVTANGDTFRTETWSDYHSQLPVAPASSTTASGTAKSSASAAGSAAGTAPAATPGLTTPTAPKPAAAPTSEVPLPPPMAAEVGGSTSSSG
ncbi:MAG: hypothetical protein ACKOQ4_01355 [Mycobacterium sp.]